MSAIAVQVRRVLPPSGGGFSATASALEIDLGRARALATLLDAQFSIAGFKFGLDPIVDLIPVVGDAAMFAAGLYPVHLARKHRLGKRLQWRMIVNLAIDFLGGLVPIAGAVFDAAYRANLKNVALLEKAVGRSRFKFN
jgi:hypothetical protein